MRKASSAAPHRSETRVFASELVCKVKLFIKVATAMICCVIGLGKVGGDGIRLGQALHLFQCSLSLGGPRDVKAAALPETL